MTRQEFLNNYWRFYILLEQRFINAISYVELCEDNYETYSIEFVSQLREIGSEIDVIMKEICGFNQDERKCMNDYSEVIFQSYSGILTQEITGNKIVFKPFEGWCLSNPSASLTWWDAYNNVKHGRVLNFALANLENVFKALGALFVLENYLLKKVVNGTNEADVSDKNSVLFVMNDWETNFISLEGAFAVTE